MRSVLKAVGVGLGSIMVGYAAWMGVIAVAPGVRIRLFPVEGNPRAPESAPLSASRQEVRFPVAGIEVAGWVYRPVAGATVAPCIVMAHGLGGTWDLGLDRYARRFQQTGFAVLALDYRHFGRSGGEPRQLAWIPSQLEDWTAAVAHARTLPGVDPARIGLWGTSLSGGHVLTIAARDASIGAVAAQVPLLAGDAPALQRVRRGRLGEVLRMGLVHAVRDLVRSWLGLSPHRIPLFGPTGSVAAMADDGAWAFINANAPVGFVNEVCARIVIRMDKYHPLHTIGQIRCPVLLQVADKDIYLPEKIVDQAARLLGSRGEVHHFPVDHFDIYQGEHAARALTVQVDFFTRHLSPAQGLDPQRR